MPSKHRFFGYQGKGVYGCECGWTIRTVQQTALPAKDGVYRWLTDQWKAHVREGGEGGNKG